MQPYFVPYIAYFQLIAAVDLFVLHDKVKYTKKGWINRNRILQHGAEAVVSLPLKHDSDFLDVAEREIAPDFRRDKLLNRIGEAYRRAPFFGDVFPLVERILNYDEPNLFRFLCNSIGEVCSHLEIGTKMVAASQFPIDHSLTGQDKVLALCKQAEASVYVNAIGGMELYSGKAFRTLGLELVFLRSRPFEYRQFGETFVPSLSIVDVMMFNPIEVIRGCLASNYDLIPPVV